MHWCCTAWWIAVDWSRRRRRRSSSSQCGIRQQHLSCDHSLYHTPALSERERERSPRPAAAVHCTPSKPPKVFPPPSSDHESKFRDQVSCFLQTFRPSFLLSANFQSKIYFFFLQKNSRARFSVFCKFPEQVFFLVSANYFQSKWFFFFPCNFFPEQVVFVFCKLFPEQFFIYFCFLQPSSSKDHHVQWQLTGVSSTSTSTNILQNLYS